MPTLFAPCTALRTAPATPPRDRLRIRPLLSALLILLFTSSTLVAAEKEWFILEMAGEKAGWMMLSDSSSGDRRTFSTETKMKMKRGTVSIEIEMSSSFVETSEGKPVSLSSRQVMGAFPQESTVTFHDDHMDLVSRQGGVENKQTLPLPEGEWVTPGQAADAMRQKIREKVESFEVRTLDPALGLSPVTIRHRLLAADVEVKTRDGKVVKATRWESTVAELPGVVTIEEYDAEANLVRAQVEMAGTTIVTTRATADVAKGELTAPEMMVSTLIRPDRPIPDARKLTRVVLDLSPRKGELPSLPSVGGQVVETTETGLRVTIQPDALQPAPKPDLEDAAYLKSSSYLDHQNPEIQKLAAKATDGAGEDPAARAEAMRRFVHDYVDEKGLDTAFATATEVARRRTGDCSEHGVLLAALLRADGIPSRVVTGLMYVDRFLGEDVIFGYHMWAQALIDGKWVDYDGVLADQRTDATHITISTSALNDDTSYVAQMSALIGLMGNLDIKVIEPEATPKP